MKDPKKDIRTVSNDYNEVLQVARTLKVAPSDIYRAKEQTKSNKRGDIVIYIKKSKLIDEIEKRRPSGADVLDLVNEKLGEYVSPPEYSYWLWNRENLFSKTYEELMEILNHKLPF